MPSLLTLSSEDAAGGTGEGSDGDTEVERRPHGGCDKKKPSSEPKKISSNQKWDRALGDGSRSHSASARRSQSHPKRDWSKASGDPWRPAAPPPKYTTPSKVQTGETMLRHQGCVVYVQHPGEDRTFQRHAGGYVRDESAVEWGSSRLERSLRASLKPDFRVQTCGRHVLMRIRISAAVSHALSTRKCHMCAIRETRRACKGAPTHV